MDLLDMISQFDFTRQEASIYITLLSEGELNGYEVAKILGISRSNTYSALASLTEKGATYAIEGTAVKYTAVPIKEMCDNRIKKLEHLKSILISNMPKKKQESEGYITIKGSENILNKMKNMILEAEERVYISVSRSIFDKVLNELESVIKKGIKTVVIVNEKTELEGAILYYSDKTKGQIRLIVDSKYVLTGDLDNGEDSTCLYSKKKNLVDLIKESLKNEIQLIEIKKNESR